MNTNFIIGKYTLESLTNGMYSNPLDLYREYIQNAVDSIDDSMEQGFQNPEEYLINIEINNQEKTIKFRDNGNGISKEKAFKTLLDIGNSQKDLRRNRGFRGIGRLSGLGYCDRLVFTTSFLGESSKSIVVFDAKKLRELLVPGQSSEEETLVDVLNQVVSCSTGPEKSKQHYFQVEMFNVSKNEGLLDSSKVHDYLIQHMPLPFSKLFRFGEIVSSKVKKAGYQIPSYNIDLTVNGVTTRLYKPYEDYIVSDRVKHIEERLQDVMIKKFYSNDRLIAILWYGKTNFNGTILNSQIKGIRVRKGNVLVGDHTTLNKYFKEERFNGWIVGEIFILDADIIPNSRRDEFEQNKAYSVLIEKIKEWANEISREIRKASCQRSLSESAQKVMESEDVNSLMIEDTDFCDEFSLMEAEESFEIAQENYFDKLALILGAKQKQTKYAVLNINHKFTNEQRITLERVFDVLRESYSEKEHTEIIESIVKKF